MQIRTSIDPHSRVPTHAVTGWLTANRVRRTVARLVEDPDYLPDRNSLWDLREAEGLSGPEDVWGLVEMIRRDELGTGRGVTAFLLKPELFFAAGEPTERTYPVGRERARVFDDLRSAAEWLDNHEHTRNA